MTNKYNSVLINHYMVVTVRLGEEGSPIEQDLSAEGSPLLKGPLC